MQKSTLIERRRESLSEKSADRSKIPILRGGGKPSEPNTPVPVPQADESVSASTSVIIGVAV